MDWLNLFDIQFFLSEFVMCCHKMWAHQDFCTPLRMETYDGMSSWVKKWFLSKYWQEPSSTSPNTIRNEIILYYNVWIMWLESIYILYLSRGTYSLGTWFIENIGIQTDLTGVRWHVLNRTNVIINVLWTIKR